MGPVGPNPPPPPHPPSYTTCDVRVQLSLTACLNRISDAYGVSTEHPKASAHIPPEPSPYSLLVIHVGPAPVPSDSCIRPYEVFAFLAICPFCLRIFRFFYPPRPSSVLIIFALKEINHIVVFFTTRLTAAVLCGWYTLTVPVVMFNIMGGEGGGKLFQGRIIYPGIFQPRRLK